MVLRKFAVCLIAALWLSTASAFASSVVYEQPDDATTSAIRTSEGFLDGAFFGFNVFDNFTLGSNTAITDVHWRGAYFDNRENEDTQNPLAAPGSLQLGFGIDFLSDNSGNPGVLLSRFIFPFAAVNETSLGSVLSPSGTRYYAEYSYDLLLSAASFSSSGTDVFDATGGTPYWIRIFANHQAPLGTVQWGWNQGTGGDGAAQQFQGDFLSEPVGDRAYALTAVPEPATLVLFGTGLAATSLRRRRSR